MDVATYQACALRTMADQNKILERVINGGPKLVQLIVGTNGLSNESGEMSEAVKSYVEYGKPLNVNNIKEEVGDIFWRLRQICDAVGLTFEECMDGNINKLSKRYPKEFSEFLAQEENRDRVKESESIQASDGKTLEHLKGYVDITFDETVYHDPGLPDPPIDGGYVGGQPLKPEYVQTGGYDVVTPEKQLSTNSLVQLGAITPEQETVIDKLNVMYREGNLNACEQDGHGWAEPSEDTADNVKPASPFKVIRKELDHSYNRYCIMCGTSRVHTSNTIGVCGNCFSTNKERLLQELGEQVEH